MEVCSETACGNSGLSNSDGSCVENLQEIYKYKIKLFINISDFQYNNTSSSLICANEMRHY